MLAFKQSCNQVSRAFTRIGRYVPCEICGKMVKRFPSQLDQAKHIYCSLNCKQIHYVKAYQEKKNCYENAKLPHSIGISFLAGKALITGVDPWTLAAKGANFR